MPNCAPTPKQNTKGKSRLPPDPNRRPPSRRKRQRFDRSLPRQYRHRWPSTNRPTGTNRVAKKTGSPCVSPSNSLKPSLKASSTGRTGPPRGKGTLPPSRPAQSQPHPAPPDQRKQCADQSGTGTFRTYPARRTGCLFAGGTPDLDSRGRLDRNGNPLPSTAPHPSGRPRWSHACCRTRAH